MIVGVAECTGDECYEAEANHQMY